MVKRLRVRGEEGNGMRKREKSMSPVGSTCDLQLVRHATIDIRRYREDLKARISFDLIMNQIERYEKRMKCGERKQKVGDIT